MSSEDGELTNNSNTKSSLSGNADNSRFRASQGPNRSGGDICRSPKGIGYNPHRQDARNYRNNRDWNVDSNRVRFDDHRVGYSPRDNRDNHTRGGNGSYPSSSSSYRDQQHQPRDRQRDRFDNRDHNNRFDNRDRDYISRDERDRSRFNHNRGSVGNNGSREYFDSHDNRNIDRNRFGSRNDSRDRSFDNNRDDPRDRHFRTDMEIDDRNRNRTDNSNIIREHPPHTHNQHQHQHQYLRKPEQIPPRNQTSPRAYDHEDRERINRQISMDSLRSGGDLSPEEGECDVKPVSISKTFSRDSIDSNGSRPMSATMPPHPGAHHPKPDMTRSDHYNHGIQQQPSTPRTSLQSGDMKKSSITYSQQHESAGKHIKSESAKTSPRSDYIGNLNKNKNSSATKSNNLLSSASKSKVDEDSATSNKLESNSGNLNTEGDEKVEELGRSKRIKRPVQHHTDDSATESFTKRKYRKDDEDFNTPGDVHGGRGRGGGRGGNTSGRGGSTTGRSSGRQIKRRDKYDYGNTPVLSVHPSRDFSRIHLGDVVINDEEKKLALYAVRSVIEMQRGGLSSQTRLGVDSVGLDARSTLAYNKIPLPSNAEINGCLDNLGARADLVWDQLVEIQRLRSRIKDGELDSELDQQNKAANGNMMTLESKGDDTTDSKTNNGNATDYLTKIVSNIVKQNIYRANEAHSMAAMDIKMEENKDKEIYETDIVTKQILKQRRKITDEIRRRKVNRLQAWEEIGDRYVGMEHKWKRYVEEVEAEQIERDNLQRVRAVSLTRQESGSTTPSTLGSRVSARLSGVPALSDVISPTADLNSDRLMQQLAHTESLNRRVKKNAAPYVAMNTPWPGPIYANPDPPQWPADLCDFDGDDANTKKEFPLYSSGTDFDIINVACNRLTIDGRRQICGDHTLNDVCPPGCNCARQVDVQERHCRPWSDMEKCIFIDKFMQYPKNFSKIAAYLTYRSTSDCIRFYYDSKKVINFKALLKEFDNRKKHVKIVWNHGESTAASVGGCIYPPRDPEDIEPLCELPFDDHTYMTMGAHPPFMGKIMNARSINMSSKSVPRLLTIAMAARRAKAAERIQRNSTL